MSFHEPRVLFGLALLIPVVLGSRVRQKKRIQALLLLGGKHSDDFGSLDLPGRYARSTAFSVLAAACVIIALAGPQWGERLVPEYRRGLDVVFAFDISRSMEATDVAPNRLARAVATALSFMEESSGLRFALVLGKGDGVLAVPLTDDAESLRISLASLGSGSMSSRGTNLEQLLDAASDAFPAVSSARRLVVLFSDGESLAGAPESAAERIAAQGITLAAVGVGTVEGGLLTADSESAAPIRTRLDESTLQAVCRLGGGPYISANHPEPATELARLAASMSSVGAADEFRREPISRYHVFLLAALLCFAAAKWAETVPKEKAE